MKKTMNKPQLSAEMEKRLREQLENIEFLHGVPVSVPSENIKKVLEIVSTALEEQRKDERKRASKIVESWMEDDEHWKPIVLAILNGDKEMREE